MTHIDIDEKLCQADCEIIIATCICIWWIDR